MEEIFRNEIELDIFTLMRTNVICFKIYLNVLKTHNTIPKLSLWFFFTGKFGTFIGSLFNKMFLIKQVFSVLFIFTDILKHCYSCSVYIKMSSKANPSKKRSQHLKRNPKRKIDNEEAELSEKEVMKYQVYHSGLWLEVSVLCKGVCED